LDFGSFGFMLGDCDRIFCPPSFQSNFYFIHTDFSFFRKATQAENFIFYTTRSFVFIDTDHRQATRNLIDARSVSM